MTIDRTDYLIAVAAACLAIASIMFVSGGRVAFNPDGAAALHVAQNLADGEGLVYKRIKADTIPPRSQPLITKPPLFPLSIALLIKSGFSPKAAGRAIILMSFALSAGILFLLGRFALPRAPAFIVAALFSIQVSGLKWGATIHEEWLFIFMAFASLLLLVSLRASGEHSGGWRWFLLGVSTASAVLASYQGLPLVLTVGGVVLFDLLRDRSRWTRFLLFVMGMIMAGFIPAIRFISLLAQGIRPSFIAGASPTWFETAAGVFGTLQVDFTGRLWLWVENASALDIVVMMGGFFLLGSILVLTARQRNLMPVALYVAVYLVVFVVNSAVNGVPDVEPRFMVPSEGLFLLCLVVVLWTGIAQNNRFVRTASALASVTAVGIFIFGQVQSYNRLSNLGEYCPSPETTAWVQQNIDPGAAIMSPQCGFQLIAETNDYFWLPIPPADEYSNSPRYEVRWAEEDILEISSTIGIAWIVVLSGENGDPLSQHPGYGQFVKQLLHGRGTDRIKLVASFDDGFVYNIQPI